MQTATLSVNGMTCGGCVASVTRVLQAVPGVAEAVVTLEPGAATVRYDSTKTSVKALVGAIEDAGFDAVA